MFYHGDRISTLRSRWRSAAENDFRRTKWYYYPVPNDVSWESDNLIKVVGTWPLGETWEVQVFPGNGITWKGVGQDDPPAPSLAPLPPFTEPDYRSSLQRWVGTARR